MVGHRVAVLLAQDDLPDFHVPHEHLIEVTTLSMGFETRVDRRCKIEGSQMLDDVAHVVVEVTTDNNRSVRVLPDNVSCDFGYPLGSFLQVRLFSRLEITVKHLNVLVAELELGPT